MVSTRRVSNAASTKLDPLKLSGWKRGAEARNLAGAMWKHSCDRLGDEFLETEFTCSKFYAEIQSGCHFAEVNHASEKRFSSCFMLNSSSAVSELRRAVPNQLESAEQFVFSSLDYIDPIYPNMTQCLIDYVPILLQETVILPSSALQKFGTLKKLPHHDTPHSSNFQIKRKCKITPESRSKPQQARTLRGGAALQFHQLVAGCCGGRCRRCFLSALFIICLLLFLLAALLRLCCPCCLVGGAVSGVLYTQRPG